jgi:hypothetical protein
MLVVSGVGSRSFSGESSMVSKDGDDGRLQDGRTGYLRQEKWRNWSSTLTDLKERPDIQVGKVLELAFSPRQEFIS